MISNKNAANSFILGFSRLYRFHPPGDDFQVWFIYNISDQTNRSRLYRFHPPGDDFQVWFIYNISDQTNRKEPHTYVI